MKKTILFDLDGTLVNTLFDLFTNCLQLCPGTDLVKFLTIGPKRLPLAVGMKGPPSAKGLEVCYSITLAPSTHSFKG